MEIVAAYSHRLIGLAIGFPRTGTVSRPSQELHELALRRAGIAPHLPEAAAQAARPPRAGRSVNRLPVAALSGGDRDHSQPAVQPEAGRVAIAHGRRWRVRHACRGWRVFNVVTAT